MQTKIHPKYFEEITVTCSCGNSFITGSTKQSISVEVCAKCHPFYTGEQRFLDTKGSVETFLKKEQQAKKYKEKLREKKASTSGGKAKESKSLRELLGGI